ncbi:hypothetical protein KKC94_01125 [Patescibacteria group bacterium]|nr:hypothetical protein [Patescibacteria group bacterium]
MNKKERNKLHKEFLIAAKNAKRWIHTCKLKLPLLEKYKVWRDFGFTSIYDYAFKLAGLNEWQVRDALRLLKKIEDKPALKQVVEEKGLGAVRPIITIATVEDQEFWAEKAKNLSRRALEAYTQEFRKKTSTHQGKIGHVTNSPPEESVNFSPPIANKIKQFLKRKNAEELLENFLDSFEEDKPEVTQTSKIPAKTQRFIIQRTDGKCAFPTCNKPYSNLHHTRRHSIENVHDPTYIHALCKAHHELAHHGLIGNEEGPPHTWYVLDRPDTASHKYFIDQQVQLIRHNALI